MKCEFQSPVKAVFRKLLLALLCLKPKNAKAIKKYLDIKIYREKGFMTGKEQN